MDRQSQTKLTMKKKYATFAADQLNATRFMLKSYGELNTLEEQLLYEAEQKIREIFNLESKK